MKGPGICIAILILTLAVSCKGSRTRIVARCRNGAPGIVYYYPDRSDTTSFISKEYYPNGKIRKIDTVQAGRLFGHLMQYYPSGKISGITIATNSPKPYTDDIDGAETDYYENGKISGQFTLKGSQLNGLAKFYNMNGVLVKEYFLKDSIKNGEYREFYENGHIYFKTTFLD